MLEYALTEEFIKFLGSLDNKEKGEMLWECQRFLSHCPGYLTHKKDDLNETSFIYSYKGEIFYKVIDDFNLRTIVAGAKKGHESSLKDVKGTIVVKESIVSLLKEDKGNHYQDELSKFLKANYFTNWFTRLLDELPKEDRSLFETKRETKAVAITPAVSAIKPAEKPVAQVVAQVEPKPISPIQAPSIPKEEHHQKQDVDGAEYEQAILAELQEAYEKRQEARKKVASAPLHHVHFAPIEEVISYKNESECLDLLLKRTRKFSCHNSENDWLIILANTVDGSFAKEIEAHYPNHVVYTDEPNKGQLRIAIIVKRNRVPPTNDEEDTGVKRMHSKEASFAPTMPKGAYENIEQDEDEEIRPRSDYGDYSVRLVKSKEASFKPVIKPINLEDDDGFEDLEEEDEPTNDMNWDASPTASAPNQRDSEPVVPKFWHCYLCGKRKVYTGEPAETITLRDGKIAYLCKKHRGKM